MADNSNPKESIQWLWQSNRDPWSETEEATWKAYSDVESLIMEEAFRAKKQVVSLDGYYIDLEEQIQIAMEDTTKQRPVMRTPRENNKKLFREERFIPDPTAPKCLFTHEYDRISPFILETRKYLRLGPNQYPSKNKMVLPVIIDSAAFGIVEEGKSIGTAFEAKKIAEMLLEKKKASPEEVWNCCAHIYSMESFLYKKINSVMRLIGSESHEPVWRSKVRTLGPFCLLLWDDPINTLPPMNKKLYRPAKLSDEQIDVYRRMAKVQDPIGTFQGFTSSTRNIDVANAFPEANAIFIFELMLVFSMNLQRASLYPEEEEELISPGVNYIVQSVEFDTNRKKHLIHLKLRQDFSQLGKATLTESKNPDQNHTYSLFYDLQWLIAQIKSVKKKLDSF